ncbi:MAG: phosphoglycerate dehydrogenase [Bryobacteraceae bacterium]
MKILVAEPLAPAGVELLRSQPGWEVIVSSPAEYAQHLASADALVAGGVIPITRQVLASAPKLRVIGRAGAGLENIDVEAATTAGVLVMSTPGGSAVAVAEHTLGLMLAIARSIPQASDSTKSGKWEEKKFLGHELRGKTLGIVGLGSIGREVVRRARAFEMRILAGDPYVNSHTASDLGVELVDLATLYAASDFITLHVALTSETLQMLNAEAFASMKTGVRIVNCARGELIDADALKDALLSGQVAGAALDVFQTEPPAAGEPLLAMENVIATPHIGGLTEEAQEMVGVRIAEQLVEYLRGGAAINAANMPAITAEQYRALEPYVALAERLGTFAAYLANANPHMVRMVYLGKIAETSTHLIRNAGLAGVLSRSLARKANVVNAVQIAADRGLDIAERREKRAGHVDAVRLELETDAGLTTVEGSVVLGRPRLIQVDGIYCEAPLTGHLTFLRNEDVPGVIGFVGTVLGQSSINIANFSVGRQDSPATPGAALEAIEVMETDQPVPGSVAKRLLEHPAIKLVRSVAFHD